MPPPQQDSFSATLGNTDDDDAASEDPASILIAHSLEVSRTTSTSTSPITRSTNATTSDHDDGCSSNSINTTEATTSSSLEESSSSHHHRTTTSLEQTAMLEEYMESPSPEKWQVLVQSIADEKRRRKKNSKSSSSSSSRRRQNKNKHKYKHHSRRRTASSDAADDDARSPRGDGEDVDVVVDDPLLFSSVEFSTPPRSTSSRGGALASVMEEDSDDNALTSTMSSSPAQIAAAECKELEMIAAFDEEGVYEEDFDDATEAEELEDACIIHRAATVTASDTSEEENYGVIESNFEIDSSNIHEEVCNAVLFPNDQTATEHDREMTKYVDKVGDASMSSGEATKDSANRAIRFVAYDKDTCDHQSCDVEMMVERSNAREEITVEDIIADLNAFMGTNSSEGFHPHQHQQQQQQTLATTPFVSFESTHSPTNGAALRDTSQSQSDGVGDQHPDAMSNQLSMLVPPNNNHNGASTRSTTRTHHEAKLIISPESRHDNAVTVQHENDDTPQTHWWKRYITWSVLVFCLVAMLAIGISLGSSNTTKNNENTPSLRPILPSDQPSESSTPSRSDLPWSHRPSSSSPPSTTHYDLSSLPWCRWGQVTTIGGEADANDWMGWSTALSSDGTIVAVGAPGSPFDVEDRPGYVKVYYRRDIDNNNGSRSWEQLGSNYMEGADDGDLFGQSLALSSDGKVLAVGAPGYFDRRDRPGYARVYSLEDGGDGSPSTWTQIGRDIRGEDDGDMSGISVALSADGGTLAVGANANGESRGRVRVYRVDGEGTDSRWKRLGRDIEGEAVSDNSGKSVDLSADGNIVAVGAPINNGENGERSGHVRVYRLSMEEGGGEPRWKRLGRDIDGEAAGDWSGRSVSLAADGTTLAIGANGNDGNGESSGHVVVYRLMEGEHGDDSSWERIGEDIEGEAADDQFGVHVALSADGTTLVIGANGNDGNGVSSGHVRVYYMENTDTGFIWKRLGRVIDGEAPGDNSGFSVAISANGKAVAIGSPWHSGTNGDASGHVRVFDIEH